MHFARGDRQVSDRSHEHVRDVALRPLRSRPSIGEATDNGLSLGCRVRRRGLALCWCPYL